MYTLFNPKTAGGDIWTLRARRRGGRKRSSRPGADERYGTVSKDGRWLAYVSNESGRYEVYVCSFPDGGIPRQVSSNGGLQPQWRADAASCSTWRRTGRSWRSTSARGARRSIRVRPRALFATNAIWLEIQPTARTYSPVRDGQRFLIASATRQAQSEPIRVVLNWPAADAAVTISGPGSA